MTEPRDKAELTDKERNLIADLNSIGNKGMAEEAERQLLNPALYESMDFCGRMQNCVNVQKEQISQGKLQRMINNAGLYYRVTINQFVPDPDSGFSIEVLQKFTNDDFIRAGRTIVFEGPSGSGKTALCCAAAMEAMKMGYSAKFYRMSDLILEIQTRDAVGRARLRDRIKKFKVLILDDYGIEVINSTVAAVLLDIINDRYGIGVTLVTSQVDFKALGNVISGDCKQVKEALKDRLFPAGTRTIQLSGKSKRGSAGEIKARS